MSESGRDSISPGGSREPPTGQGPASRASCLNCGDARSGRYCAQCGQNDRNYMRALLPMLWELIREAFEVDSRVPRTLGLLFVVPGSLSREFSVNRRARYSSPVRLYLFASFVFFLVLSLAVPDTMPDGGVQVGVDDLNEANSLLEGKPRTGGCKPVGERNPSRSAEGGAEAGTGTEG